MHIHNDRRSTGICYACIKYSLQMSIKSAASPAIYDNNQRSTSTVLFDITPLLFRRRSVSIAPRNVRSRNIRFIESYFRNADRSATCNLVKGPRAVDTSRNRRSAECVGATNLGFRVGSYRTKRSGFCADHPERAKKGPSVTGDRWVNVPGFFPTL